MLTEVLKWLLGLFALLGLLAGCGGPDDRTLEQKEADASRTLAYLDKAAEIAEKHGAAYVFTLDIGGRPSVGQDLKFYLDTDISATMVIRGNHAAERVAVARPEG